MIIHNSLKTRVKLCGAECQRRDWVALGLFHMHTLMDKKRQEKGKKGEKVLF